LHIHLDPLGGVAGDMIVAALADARPDLAPDLEAALARLGDGVAKAVLSAHGDGVLTGRRFAVETGDHGDHHHASLAEVEGHIEGAGLPPAVAARARAIYRLLAEAEAGVHGIPIDKVMLHEVGAWDSIVDVTAAAWLIEAIGAESWSCGPLPLGGGTVETAHGTLPVPAPATARLLADFRFVDDGIVGERVTPTGAAILRHLAPSQDDARPAGRLAGIGHGFGTRVLPGRSNVLRALLIAPDRAAGDEDIAVIGFEVDDQSPEDLALALDRLRALDGVRDVAQWPQAGKKGRLGVHVQMLAAPAALERALDAALAETATLGVRWRIERRRVLERRDVAVEGIDGVVRPVRVKLAERPGGARTAKAESDDVMAGGYAARSAVRQAAEWKALLEDPGDDEEE
jgi:uncharacterized protein (TIGR00299 family) protein